MHVSYLTSAPSIVLCLQRENAVYRLQQVLGPTDPQTARRLGQHFWRAIFGSDAIANGLHGKFDKLRAKVPAFSIYKFVKTCVPSFDQCIKCIRGGARNAVFIQNNKLTVH